MEFIVWSCFYGEQLLSQRKPRIKNKDLVLKCQEIHIEFLLYMKVSKCIQFLVYPTSFEMVTNYLEKTLKWFVRLQIR